MIIPKVGLMLKEDCTRKGWGGKTSCSGAGATSMMEFINVRSITVNFCQNASKREWKININVGGVTASAVIDRP